MCLAGRVLKRIARENVSVSLTLPASLPGNCEFARRCGTQSVEKSDSVTGALGNISKFDGKSLQVLMGK